MCFKTFSSDMKWNDQNDFSRWTNFSKPSHSSSHFRNSVRHFDEHHRTTQIGLFGHSSHRKVLSWTRHLSGDRSTKSRTWGNREWLEEEKLFLRWPGNEKNNNDNQNIKALKSESLLNCNWNDLSTLGWTQKAHLIF